MPRQRKRSKNGSKHSLGHDKHQCCPICNKKITNLSKHLSSPANQHCNHVLGDRSIVSLIPSYNSTYKINNKGQSRSSNTNTTRPLMNYTTIDTIQSIHASMDVNQSQYISSTNNHLISKLKSKNEIDDFSMDIDSVDLHQSQNDEFSHISKDNTQSQTILLRNMFENNTSDRRIDNIINSSRENDTHNIMTQLQQLEITPSDLSSDDVEDCGTLNMKSLLDNHISITPYTSNNTSRRVTRSMHNNIDPCTLKDPERFHDKQDINDSRLHNPDLSESSPTTSVSSLINKDNALTASPIDFLPFKYDYRSFQTTIWKNRYDQLHMDVDTLSSLKLLKIMSKSNIPNYLFSEIMEWFEQSYLDKLDSIKNKDTNIPSHCYDYIPKSKDKVLKDIKTILINGEERFDLKPKHKILQLPSGRFVRHSSISIEAIIYSLISIPEILNEENSLLHNQYYRNPCLIDSIPKSERTYHDIHTGWWFKNAYQRHCTDIRDVLCPVILFIDGTAIDTVGKLKLEAIMLTLGIFTRPMRNKAEAWRLLGFICDPNKENLGNDKYTNQVEKRTDYHYILRDLLQELYELESSDGIIIDIPCNYGNTIETVRLKVCLMFVMGDAVGHDNLCDMFLSYTSASAFLCRDCNCPSQHLNDPLWQCQITNRVELVKKSAPELLKHCYYKVNNNAFDRHTFGGDSSKINGCSPPEILHQFLKGPLEDTIHHFFETITIPALDFFDNVGKYISLNWHRQSARDFPNIQIFKDGLQKNHLCGKELFSQLFMIYLTLIQTYTMTYMPAIERSSQPRHKLKKVKLKDPETQSETTNLGKVSLEGNDRSQNKKNVFINEKHLFNKVADKQQSILSWIKLIELTFCFYQWQIQTDISVLDFEPSVLPTINNNGNESVGISPAKKQIQLFMALHNKVICDRLGNGTNKAKFHWNLHLDYYGPKFGCFLNTDGGIGERHLKKKVKEPARRTQKRQYVLAKQACERDYERTVIDTMFDIMSLKGIVSSSNTSNPIQNIYPTANDHKLVDNIHPSLHLSRQYTTLGNYVVQFDDDLNNIKDIRNSSRKVMGKKIFLEHTFIKQVMDRLKSDDYQIRSSHLSCFTTLKFQKDWIHHTNDVTKNVTSDNKFDDVIFRADPWYYGKPWFDWCVTNWNGDDTIVLEKQNTSTNFDDESYYPSKILMFIDPSTMDFGNTSVETNDTLWAVVQSTTDDLRTPNSRPNVVTKLIDTYQIDNKIRIISCDTIIRDAYVICDVDSVQIPNRDERNYKIGKTYRSQHVMCLKPIETWASLFIDGSW